MKKLISSTWGKITAVVALIGTLGGWYSTTVDWYESDINEFIEKSVIDEVVVEDDMLIVTYHTAPLPNINYRTEYWLTPVKDFRASYKLAYADTIVKDQFPEPIYKTFTRWTGDGIPIGDIPEGEYEIHVKYYFKGHRKERVMKPIKFKKK